jgi:hypothetical protein
VKRPSGEGNFPSLASIVGDASSPPNGALRVVMEIEEYTPYNLRSTRQAHLPSSMIDIDTEESLTASYVKAEVLHRKMSTDLMELIKSECEYLLQKESPNSVLPTNIYEWLATRLSYLDEAYTWHLRSSDIRDAIMNILQLERSCKLQEKIVNGSNGAGT